jgi:hypothetical protein
MAAIVRRGTDSSVGPQVARVVEGAMKGRDVHPWAAGLSCQDKDPERFVEDNG